MDLQVAYLLLVTLSVLLLGSLSVYAWRFRREPLAARFIAVAASATGWALLVAILATTTPELAPFWVNVKYAFIAATPLTLLLFAAEFAGRPVSPRLLALLLVIPLVTQLVVWTNPLHHLMLRDIQFEQRGSLTYQTGITFGQFYWVFTGYSYALVIAGAVLVWRGGREGAALRRGQSILVTAGICMPLVANVLLLTRALPSSADPMPFGLVATAALFWWGALRHALLDLVPVARHQLVDVMHDGMLGVDARGRVVDVNAALLQLLGSAEEHVVGRPVDDALARHPALRELLRATLGSSGASGQTRAHPFSHGDRHFDVRVVPLRQPGRTARGDLVVLQDVTEQRQAHLERERLITELREALGTVKRLEGLLPICASCKNIRDERDQWLPVEQFIRQRTAAEFTHGICPTCVDRLYPEHATA